MYGGWGNDYLNADDVLDTGGVANLGTDTNPSYEDLAYGGAGRDVLLANTGGDRLIDWSGEYNSYLSPFAPFGMATVSRTVQPQLPEYLYHARAQSDGADPYLAAHYVGDPARNGEPYGELGIVLQHDAAWGDQRGKPRDPQAGNSPGVQRDVLRTSGTKPLNSPGTDPPAAAAATTISAAPTAQMAAYVGNNDQHGAPLVVVGPIGALARYTITDGTHSISGSGTIGLDGKFAFSVDVSGMNNGTLSITVTVTVGGTSAGGATSIVKDTVLPGSVGVALPGFVGAAGIGTAGAVLSGDAGNFVEYAALTPDGSTLYDAGYLDELGRLPVSFDLNGYPDGVYTLVAIQYDEAWNQSEIQVAPYQLTLDTVAPTGSFTVNHAPSDTALTNNPAVSLQLSFGDDRSGVYLMQYTVDGGLHWSAWQPYSGSIAAVPPAPDGTYSVAVQVADRAGNTFIAIQHVILDRTGPAISATLPARSSGAGYDVGTPLVLGWIASDLNGVVSSSAGIEGQTISASGGAIDVDVLTAGVHTVWITARDRAGNVTTISLTFTIVPTAQGIRNAIDDGARRGWISLSFQSSLDTQIDQVIKALWSSSANAKAKLRQFISTVEHAPSGGITAAYEALLLNWANDLLGASSGRGRPRRRRGYTGRRARM